MKTESNISKKPIVTVELKDVAIGTHYKIDGEWMRLVRLTEFRSVSKTRYQGTFVSIDGTGCERAEFIQSINKSLRGIRVTEDILKRLGFKPMRGGIVWEEASVDGDVFIHFKRYSFGRWRMSVVKGNDDLGSIVGTCVHQMERFLWSVCRIDLVKPEIAYITKTVNK